MIYFLQNSLIITAAAIALFVFLRWIEFLRKTLLIRRSWTRLPGAPRSWTSGNMSNMAPMLASVKHPDYGLYEIWQSLGRPDWFLVDLWPQQVPMIIIADPTIAETFSRATASEPWSTPKMKTPAGLKALLGVSSVSIAQGWAWRPVRQRLNPMFQPKAVHSFVAQILDHTDMFVNRLLQASRQQVDVALGDLLADLATDVISSCLIGYNLEAQTSSDGEKEKGPEGILTCLREGVAVQPLFFGSGLSALYRRISAWRKLRRIKRTVDTRLASVIQQDPKSGFAARYIGLDTPTPSLLQEAVEQAKTLLLAGQDTTSCAIQWCFFYLWKHPEVLKKLRTELDIVLGTGVGSDSAQLRDKTQLLHELQYTSAVIKETLRLRGISGTTREITVNTAVEVDGESVLVEPGAIFFVNNYILMKNPKCWGPDAENFRPERFLESQETGKEMRNIAYRPFERGPRNCIAQELVMMEMRIVLLLTVRRFNFVKTGYDGITDEEVYDVSRVVHSPVDQMKMLFSERVISTG